MPNHSRLRVRRASLADLPRLVPLFDAYRVFYDEASDPRGAEAFLEGRLRRNESVVFIATSGLELVGFTQLYPSFSSVTLQRLWILNDLFVRPEDRSRGVAEALLVRAQRFARTTHSKGLALETAVTNPAQRLYERLGWERGTDFFHYFWKVPARKRSRIVRRKAKGTR